MPQAMPHSAVIAREEGGHVAISGWLVVFKDAKCIFVGMRVLICVCGGRFTALQLYRYAVKVK